MQKVKNDKHEPQRPLSAGLNTRMEKKAYSRANNKLLLRAFSMLAATFPFVAPPSPVPLPLPTLLMLPDELEKGRVPRREGLICFGC
jgi:hypothetical protein